MSNIIQISNFGSGRNSIAVNTYQEATLQDYIDKWERNYLLELLGGELYDLFIADLVGGIPQTARFVAIYDEFYETIYGEQMNSEGMIEMLKGLIYFEYVRDGFNTQMTTGIKKSKGENTDFVNMQGHDLYTRFNNAGETFEAIRAKLCNESDTYPEYDGKQFEFIINL